jgi:hypothetical protein
MAFDASPVTEDRLGAATSKARSIAGNPVLYEVASTILASSTT